MPRGSDSVNAAVRAVVRSVRALPAGPQKRGLIRALNQLAAAYARLFRSRTRRMREEPLSFWPIDF
jgi:hypothetical protein